MGCLDEATLDDLVQGRLSGESLRVAEAHMDACRSCSDVVSVLAGGAPTADVELPPGARVGRHVVVSCIGRGAMGVVYAADDPELHRRVALKLLRAGAGPEAAERTMREAQSLARVAHPNVVAIYDVGREGGDVYFAMELVVGRTLRAWLASEARPTPRILDVMLQAGRGLAAAHAAGVIHRDFKPENVMVGDDGRVRVTDFGLARAAGHLDRDAPLDDGVLLAPTLTRTGRLLGTPAYMAPEQIAGGEVTARSDQFAFGVTLFEALTGARPFAGATLSELETSIARGVPRESLRASPTALRDAIVRAVRADPEKRFASVSDLLDELAPLARPRRRWPVVVAVVAPLAAAGAIVAGASLVRERDVCGGADVKLADVWNEQRKAAIQSAFEASKSPLAGVAAARVTAEIDRVGAQFVDQYRATCEATHVRREQSESVLDARMRCLDRQWMVVLATIAAFERADAETVRGAAQAASELPSPDACAHVESLAAMDPRPADEGRATRLSELEREIGDLRAQGAAGHYADALTRAKAAAGEADAIGYRPAVAEVALLVAELSRKTADYEAAAVAARKALAAAEASHADRVAAGAWLEILAVDGERGDPARVVDNAELASATLIRLGDPEELRASLLGLIGVAHTQTGALDDAQGELERALALHERIHGPESLFVARTLSSLGSLARARGRYEDALALHARALALDGAILGAIHPGLAVHHHNAAGILRLLERYEEARIHYDDALRLEVAGLGAEHPRVGLTENSLGMLAIDTSDLESARGHLERALAILGGAEHPDRSLALWNLGRVDARQGRHPEAVERYTKALEIVRQRLGADHWRAAGILLERARSERVTNNDRATADDLAEARRIAVLHAGSSPEAAALGQAIAAELAIPAKAAPPKPAPPPPLGPMGYGSATVWDSQ